MLNLSIDYNNMNKKVRLKLLAACFIFLPLTMIFSEIPEDYNPQINELNEVLIQNGIPQNWLIDNINNNKFTIYYKIKDYFNNMAENKVKRNEVTFEWYKKHFHADLKVAEGINFIKNNQKVLEKIENKNGIHYELVTAILAMESNYAHPKYKGKFYTFPALVSQYLLIPRRKKFSSNELIALYKFCIKTNKETYHFIGSFAGACGWAQFIPSSLLAYFVDYNERDYDIDIYSIEDNLASIANYLYNHKLNRATINYEKNRYNAVYAYNRSDAYVKTVLYIYDNLKKYRINNNENN